MRRLAALLILLTGSLSLSLSAAGAQSGRATPYWASIAAGRAMMRTGPGQNYPGTWLYTRADLPIQVVEVYQNWRKIRDPDGTTGWMMVNLLSDQRTAIVRGSEARAMHEAPDEATPIRYRAAPGLVGRVSRCADGWCRFDAQGRDGYIRIVHVWGVGQNETIR